MVGTPSSVSGAAPATEPAPVSGSTPEFGPVPVSEPRLPDADEQLEQGGQRADAPAAGERGGRVARRPLVPPAWTGAAKSVGAAGWRHTRRHTTIVARGAEQQRQRRKADREQGDLKAARGLAVARGDYEQAREISRQLVQERYVGAEALKARIELTWMALTRAAVVVLVLAGIAIVAGTVNAFGHWLGPWDALDVLYLLGALVAGGFYTAHYVVTHWQQVAACVLAIAGVVWVSRRWRDGKRLGEHVLPIDLRRGDAVTLVDFDESALVTALANIGVPALKEAVKDGWPNRATDRAWVQFPVVDGNGMTASLRLPLGAPVEKLRKAKVTLAHNLGCLPAELWIERNSDDATVMDLFRLNPGELRKPVPDYPLLHEGTTDYFTGFPVGISPRGQEITGHTNERNYVVSGIMGSGKSTLVLTLLAGAILDPLVDIDVFVFAQNADYDGLKDCFDTFVMGDTAENVQACRDHIADLHADLERRGELLQKHGVNSVNRQVAAKEPGLRPRIVVIDECQSYFRQDKPEDRRAVVNQIVRFFSAARKYGITCVFVTPVPSDQSLPRDLVSVTTNRACYAIGDKTRNNVVLGEKAHENGISALGLKPRTKDELRDVGTSITVGFTEEDGTVLRSYYLSRPQQEQLAQRAKQLRSGAARQRQPEPRDVLTDALEVMGTEVTRASHVADAMAARWGHYHAGASSSSSTRWPPRGSRCPPPATSTPSTRTRCVTPWPVGTLVPWSRRPRRLTRVRRRAPATHPRNQGVHVPRTRRLTR
ncbi:hypothetical protein BJF90_39310 [Pseudonocardia sp. CNS-004]|nr:hypothetical protein BJF90_39310 [Pseudonocardia sp. CNS-004]